MQKFDDIATTPVVPEGSEVGTYQGLFWQFETANSAPLGFVNGIVPNTQPNVAAFGVVGELKGQTGTVSIIGGTKSFDLLSFFFGCCANTVESTAEVPEGCAIAVTAFDVYGKMLSTLSRTS